MIAFSALCLLATAELVITVLLASAGQVAWSLVEGFSSCLVLVAVFRVAWLLDQRKKDRSGKEG